MFFCMWHGGPIKQVWTSTVPFTFSRADLPARHHLDATAPTSDWHNAPAASSQVRIRSGSGQAYPLSGTDSRPGAQPYTCSREGDDESPISWPGRIHCAQQWRLQI